MSLPTITWESPRVASPVALDFVFAFVTSMKGKLIRCLKRRESAGRRPLDQCFDLVVIGGGINGCGIARDAAGRGLSVVLCEMGDLASGTSSWSTKLIHGGLRYLEQLRVPVGARSFERSVRFSGRIAPHIIRPLRFVLPHRPGLRSARVLRLGLFLYDHIGGRNGCAERAPSVWDPISSVGPSNRASSPRASNIRIAASTIHVSSSSTRGTRPIAAPRSAAAP